MEKLNFNFIVQQFFDTSFKILDVKVIADGLINKTYLLTIASGSCQKKYILQNVNTHVFKTPLAIQNNIEKLSKHLESVGYPEAILKPKLRLNNTSFVVLDEVFWRMFEEIETTYTVHIVENKLQAFEVAQFFGDFHKFINLFCVEKIEPVLPSFLDFKKRIDDFQLALSKGNSNRKLQCEKLIQFAIDNLELPTLWIELEKEEKLPKRLIHADPKISNVLFDINSKKPKAIIDWDTIMIGSVLYDFGDMVRSYCNLTEEDEVITNNFSEEIFQQLKEGYLSSANYFLKEIEIEYLKYAGEVIIYIQFLRFLTDYLLDDVYYAVTYSEQNLNRATNQMNLLIGLQAIKS